MIRKNIILVAIAGAFLVSCSNTSNTEEVTVEVEATHEDHAHHDADLSEEIELENGQKWKVNEEMTPFLLGGKQIVADYLAADGTDYQQLAADVKEQNSQLIKSCTMQGKSHDELHKWLHPHLDLVKALEATTDADEASKLVNKLKISYDTYSNYFE